MFLLRDHAYTRKVKELPNYCCGMGNLGLRNRRNATKLQSSEGSDEVTIVRYLTVSVTNKENLYKLLTTYSDVELGRQ